VRKLPSASPTSHRTLEPWMVSAPGVCRRSSIMFRHLQLRWFGSTTTLVARCWIQNEGGVLAPWLQYVIVRKNFCSDSPTTNSCAKVRHVLTLFHASPVLECFQRSQTSTKLIHKKSNSQIWMEIVAPSDKNPCLTKGERRRVQP
jgi:hypothetical protein